MHMEVGPQLLVPRVQHERETDFAAQLLAAKLQERLSRRVEQELEQGALVALAVQDQSVQLMRQREHVVKIGHRQELLSAGRHPRGRGRSLALGAMPVAATVVRVAFETASRAPLSMAAQGGRTATDDRPAPPYAARRSGDGSARTPRRSAGKCRPVHSQRSLPVPCRLGTAFDMTTRPRRPQALADGAVQAGCGCVPGACL